jgi:ribonucleoside-diphosphate reductase beta chain
MPVFKEPSGVKYQFMDTYTEALMNMFWKFDSVPLGKDVEHYKRACASNPREARFIEEVMKLFTTSEVLVKSGYAKMATIFKPNEVVNWCMYAGGSEVVHEKAYSLFTETIGLPDSTYTDFLDISVMKTKTAYIDKAKVRKWEDYKAMGLSDAETDFEFRRAVARMLAIYGGGTELITLYAQFAMLLAFQMEGKYPGLCQIVEYSIRDEYTHGIANCKLFRTYIAENPDIWDDELKFDVYEAIREIVSYEECLIDHFDPPHMDNDTCKQYIRYQADEALKEMGMKPNYNVSSNPYSFMDEVTGTVLTDFFSGKVTAYSRKMVGTRDDLRAKLQERLLDETVCSMV